MPSPLPCPLPLFVPLSGAHARWPAGLPNFLPTTTATRESRHAQEEGTGGQGTNPIVYYGIGMEPRACVELGLHLATTYALEFPDLTLLLLEY